MPAKPVVVLSLLGPTLDAGFGRDRWTRWRPNVALCQYEDLVVSRLELLYDPQFTRLARVVAEDVEQVSPETDVREHLLPIADPWDFEEVYGALHDFARGYAFAPEREEYLVHITTGTHVAQICLFLLTESRRWPGRLLQTNPPKGRGAEPAGTYSVIDLDLSRYDRLASRFREEATEGQSLLKAGIATRNAAFNVLIAELEHVAAATRAPLLLLGPTGAGKTQLARRIHALKKTRQKLEGRLVEVNCATLAGDQAKSALFGHTRGAFTGATEGRAGLLRAAHGGLLFLDEIGALGLDEQAMLLHAVEDKAFYPVGADKPVTSDFQLIAGTNEDLFAASARGSFRPDLLARLNLWTFELPGLRDRIEDLPPNLDFELEQAGVALGARVAMSREARERYLAFAASGEALWSGNFRDLNASVLRMATMARGGRIDAAGVEREVERLRRTWAALGGAASTATRAPGGGQDVLSALLGQAADDLDRFDRVQLEDVVNVCVAARSLSDAGRILFAASRAKKASINDADRLRKYLARFGLTFPQVQALRG